MTQYRIIRKRDGKLLGYIIGKTRIQNKPYLVYSIGNKTGRLKIDDVTERFYRVEKIEVQS